MKRKITKGFVRATLSIVAAFGLIVGVGIAAPVQSSNNPAVEVIHLITPQRADAVVCASGYICGFPCAVNAACGTYYRVSQGIGLNVYTSLHLSASDVILSISNASSHQFRVYHYDLFHGGCGSASSLVYANHAGNMNADWQLQNCIKRVS